MNVLVAKFGNNHKMPKYSQTENVKNSITSYNKIGNNLVYVKVATIVTYVDKVELLKLVTQVLFLTNNTKCKRVLMSLSDIKGHNTIQTIFNHN